MLLKFNKSILILLIILIFIASSCAKAIYYEPEGFDNLLNEIRRQTEYFYKGEIFCYNPAAIYIDIYIKKDISDEKVEEIKELIIFYVQGEQFRNFLEGTNLYYDDDGFAIILTIETQHRTFVYSSHKKYDFNDWNGRELK